MSRSRFSHRDLSDLSASRSRSRERDLSRDEDLSRSALSMGRDLSRSSSRRGGDLSRGRGSVRSLSDATEDAAIMRITRRDADNISRDAVRDTDTFLQKRRAKGCEKPINPIVAALEIVGSAILAGYFTQKLRSSGAVVPVGVVAGLLGHVAAYYDVFGGANHIRNISNGAIAGSGAIWGTGIGALSNENAAAKAAANPNGENGANGAPNGAPNTGHAPPALRQKPYVPVYAYPNPQNVPVTPVPAVPQPAMSPSLTDLQNLWGGRAA